jgi:hypothetical protein
MNYRDNILTQFKIMLNKKGFIISFCFMIAFSLYSYLMGVFELNGLDRYLCRGVEGQFLLNFLNSNSEIWCSIYPMIIILPFCFSVIIDKEIHINDLMIVRGSRKKYYISKAVVAFIGAFLICFVPLIINNFLNSVTFYDGVTNISWVQKLQEQYSADLLGTNVIVNTKYKIVPLVGLYVRHPIIFNYVWALFVSTVAGFISVFVFACSFYIKRYTVFLFLPFYLIITVLGKLTPSLSTNNYISFNFEQYIQVNSLYGRSYSLLWMFIGFLLLIAILLIRREYKKDF